MPQTSIAEKVIDFLQQEETDYAGAAKLGEAALPVLNSIVTGSDVGLASKATYLASMIKSDHKGEVIVNAAKHPSALVRVAAASAAQSISPASAETVLNKLIDDSDIGVTKFALKSVKAHSFGAKYGKQLKAMSVNHQDEGIKTMAKSMLVK